MTRPLVVSRLFVLPLTLAMACDGGNETVSTSAAAADAPAKADAGAAEGAAAEAKPTAADAAAFAKQVDAELRALWVESSRAQWANATDITEAHGKAESAANEKVLAYTAKAIKEAQRFDGVEADADTMRQLRLLSLSTSMPAPDDAAKRKELAEIATELQSMYGKGKSCKTVAGKEECRDINDLMKVLAESRDYDELTEAWTAWRTISPEMRPKYQRFVELTNEGAKEIGFSDTGELWRSGYDMSADAFEKETERLWQQVKPMYEQLHCHVRAKLGEHYGADKVPANGLIPAQLLGNLWAQEWANIYPLMEPYSGQPSIDVTAALQKAEFDEVKMVKQAESFFVSLGLDPLPKTFWERSMLKKPDGKEAVCHASAWDVELDDDLRIKMCIKIDMEDLITIHHELGHNYYYHYYTSLPVLFQSGAHDGFHEGIGDTLALSVTPKYLNSIGLLDAVSEDPKAVINNQMQDALDKIAFLPFGLLIDRWRWKVFKGEIPPEKYNEGWWELRRKYQGIDAPVDRTEKDFDPGAKYHIPGNTPYSRYFLARVLQFQFHKALCDAAGHEGPLYTCSIHGSKEAGKKLQAMLAMGASKPWPDALEAVTGTRQMDAGPMLEYFEPLTKWLAEQNQGRTCGW
jgi:peptidyl-dipeptidase A